ncbi:glucosamine-6-phosphate deaminase [Paenochrobactrum sp. BZR 588]|uniref:glucosamine-6-phosphate deaminase n=1 Tax=unclassified Paenochrobactrum TaxID=2639760 RepID=UPI003853AE8A
MKVLICPDRDAAIERAKGIIIDHVHAQPKAVLGLATGGTMVPLYEQLVSAYHAGKISFADVTTFNLDEYIGIPPEHPCSYHTYMRDILFRHIDIDQSRTHLPHGLPDNVDAEADRYEAEIAAAGGISLQLLGIGKNGHIGFNEPSSSLTSRTRVKTLTENTRAANRQYFPEGEETPRFALTMGIGTILDARKCLLIATGADKAQAVADMVEGPVSAVCPASALQFHRHATIITDREAAAKLRLTDYYQYVHPDGK